MPSSCPQTGTSYRSHLLLPRTSCSASEAISCRKGHLPGTTFDSDVHDGPGGAGCHRPACDTGATACTPVPPETQACTISVRREDGASTANTQPATAHTDGETHQPAPGEQLFLPNCDGVFCRHTQSYRAQKEELKPQQFGW